jgi:cytochrome c
MVKLIPLFIILLIGTAACSSRGVRASDHAVPQDIGDPDAGRELFNARHGEAPACSMCHVVDSNQRKVGPSLMGVASRAKSRVEGLDAIGYLRQSILEPDAFYAPNAGSNRMYQHFAEVFTPQQVDDLVAYLLTLE